MNNKWNMFTQGLKNGDTELKMRQGVSNDRPMSAVVSNYSLEQHMEN